MKIAEHSTPWKVLFPLLVSTLVMFVAYLHFNIGYGLDDSYITFRYAQNALAGHGFVFNVGEHHYGSTATGYAMLLAGLVKSLSWVGIFIEVPLVSTVLSGLAVAMIAYIAGHACIGKGLLINQLCSVVVAVFVFILPLSSVVSAHETYAFVGLLALGSYLVVMKGRLYLGTVIFVITTTIRPDSLLFAIIQFAALLFILWINPSNSRYRLSQLIVAIAIFLAGVLLWITAMKLYYGTFLPGTMDAKKAQVQIGHWPIFSFRTVFYAMKQLFAGHYWLLLILPLVLCIWRFLGNIRREGRNLQISSNLLYAGIWAVFAVGVSFAYIVFNVSLWIWYVVPIGIALLLSAFYAVASLVETEQFESNVIGQKMQRGVFRSACLIVLIVAVGLSIPELKTNTTDLFTEKHINDHVSSYDTIIRYIKKHEPKGTSIAIAEPGNFGYKLGPDYKVHDVLGLTSPNVAKALQQGDLNYVIRERKPMYVVISWNGSYNPDQQPGFAEQYEWVDEFHHKFWDEQLGHGAMLYKRKTSVH